MTSLALCFPHWEWKQFQSASWHLRLHMPLAELIQALLRCSNSEVEIPTNAPSQEK